MGALQGIGGVVWREVREALLPISRHFNQPDGDPIFADDACTFRITVSTLGMQICHVDGRVTLEDGGQWLAVSISGYSDRESTPFPPRKNRWQFTEADEKVIGQWAREAMEGFPGMAKEPRNRP